jgi:hypothetical protein
VSRSYAPRVVPRADRRPPAIRLRLDRVPVLGLGAVALVTGLWGGLARLGWTLPATHAGAAALHGPLMVSGFLGTLITLERAAALQLGWAYAAPLATGVGAVVLATGVAPDLGRLLVLGGSLAALTVFATLLRRVPGLFMGTMTLGVAAWTAGNALWAAGWTVDRVVPWWSAFLVLVIAGERLELTRLHPPPRGARAAFVAVVVVLAAGMGASIAAPGPAARLAGAGMLGLAAWLARYDVARRTIRESGVTRYMAACLLSGYAWLGVSGLLAVHEGLVVAGPRYDAVVHALFLGFVMTMVFGHAPVILPGVLGVPVAWRPAFYAPLVGLHATLAARLVGDLVPLPALRQWAGLLNAAMVVGFLAGAAATAVRAASRPAGAVSGAPPP